MDTLDEQPMVVVCVLMHETIWMVWMKTLRKQKNKSIQKVFENVPHCFAQFVLVHPLDGLSWKAMWNSVGGRGVTVNVKEVVSMIFLEITECEFDHIHDVVEVIWNVTSPFLDRITV